MSASPAKKAGAKKASKPTHPPTLEMITKAISTEKDPKGTSVMAIKKHILAHNQIKSAQLLNHMLRRAFEAGLAAGKLTRPKGQTDSSLLAGRYRLAAAKAKKPKAATDKPKKVVKKVAKSPAKKAKSPAKKAAKSPAKKAKSPAKKAAAKKPKAKSPAKKTAAKKTKAVKKPAAKKTPKKSPAKKAAAKKSPKKAGKK
ncbi:late histone H1-like [Amphibalanus amphitrite]|uniref:late histone H1-like n=1 Tax=Amphibalanus amphitrite TaxID=1232801 RepID=UPI001C923A1B|nr:late histone H1-like [Amphibalanus amphitrite]XP_043201974.1 late histone H1-like [Amphibalanus amphitrite]